MDDLVVDNQFSSSIIDDQSSDTSSSIGKRAIDLAVQATLIDDRQTLLNITTLRHADKSAVVTHIQDTILLEDRSQHTLYNDRVSRVADE